MKWISLLLCIVLAYAAQASDQLVELSNPNWTVTIDPQWLTAYAKLPDGPKVCLSTGVSPANFHEIPTKDKSVHLRDDAQKISVEFILDGNVLTARFVAEEPGKFKWPIVFPGDTLKAYLLPMFEGVRVPVEDAPWADFLEKQSPLDTTAGLSMPFFATQSAGHTLTYLLPNPFNNELSFSELQGKLTASLTHEFTRNHAVKEYSVRIVLGGDSDVEPARVFRGWLQSRGDFVSFKQKIAQTPDAAKLPGAAHIYLWGNGLLSKMDLVDAPGLARDLLTPSAISDRIGSLLDADGRAALKEIAAKPRADLYDRSRVAEALDAVLDRADFYDPELWKDAPLPPQAVEILKQAHVDRTQLNAALFEAAYGSRLAARADWGNGFSLKMLRDFQGAGLDRLWLGSPDWSGLRDHPEFIKEALARGYLIGPYDSFHSIHSPAEKDTWETAQFDQALYESGGVVKADGSKKKGFKQKGYILSPLAARDAVERRVRNLVDEFHCNSWFIDCDAFGEVFDDYSPAHSATQEQDMQERLRRMAWIRDTFHLVIGSEGGSSYAAGTIHFAHGMMTPVIGWGDPDLNDRKSPYFLGRYYPPDQPEMSFKQVPMKPVYQRIYADPVFRIPLYQVALHDSIITTHEWGEGSLKFADPDHARELLELLYNVPPLYHMNLAEWEKRKGAIAAHYTFFSPLHREAALLPMTEWSCLSDDRQVQRTRFGAKLEMLVNFSSKPFTYQEQAIPPRSAMAYWLDGRKAIIYSPQ